MTAGGGIAVSGLRAGYGPQEVLHGIDFHVEPGEVVALLGANGAGKTTTLLAIAGWIRAKGDIHLFGEPATGPLWRRARKGLALLPETRAIVRRLTVAENLRLAGCDTARALATSPELAPLLHRKVGILSGGEQQILSLTQAMATDPEILMADELSSGLAPIVVRRMIELARVAADQGAAVLLVEQFAHQVLHFADRGYVMQRGTIVTGGSASELLSRIDDIEAAYLGTGDKNAQDTDDGAAETRPTEGS
ncbi:MAG: ABC transporter ATP-binding protein [Acidimicrobiia bacterium]